MKRISGEDESSFSALPRVDCSSELKEGPIKAPELPLDDAGSVSSPSVSQHNCAGGAGIKGLFSFRQLQVVRRACVWNPRRLGALVLRQEGSKCPKSAFVVPLAATFPEIFSFLSPSRRPCSFFALQTSETSQIRCLTRSKTPVSFLMHMQVFQTEI